MPDGGGPDRGGAGNWAPPAGFEDAWRVTPSSASTCGVRETEPPAQSNERTGLPAPSAVVLDAGHVSEAGLQPCWMVMGIDRAVMGDLLEDDMATVSTGEPWVACRSRALPANDRPE